MNGLNTINADEISTENFSATNLTATNLTATTGNITTINATTVNVSGTTTSGSLVANGGGNRLQIFTDTVHKYWVYSNNGTLTNSVLKGNINYRGSISGSIETCGDITIYNGTVIPGVGLSPCPDLDRLFLGKSLIGYYNITTGAYNWSISNDGTPDFKDNSIPDNNLSLNVSLLNVAQIFSGLKTFTGGITANGTQTINFGINAPTMYGTNISNIPLTSITGLSTTYVDLANPQTISGAKTFTGGIQLTNTVSDNLIAYNLTDTNNYFAIRSNATICGYHALIDEPYWQITQIGNAELNSLTILNGLYATNGQTIDFGINTPTMKGTNITDIPASSFIGYLNLVYKNIQNYFTAVQHFEANVQFENTTVGGTLFQAKKNSGVGNAGYILAGGSGSLSYFDSVLSANKWMLDDSGKLTTTGGIIANTTQTIDFGLNVIPNVMYKNLANVMTLTTSPTTATDIIRIMKTSPDTDGGRYIYMGNNGKMGYGVGGTDRWQVDALGQFYTATSMQVGNNLYSPNNGKFSVCLGQSTPLSTAINSVVIGYNAGHILGASANSNVVIGSQALPVNTNTQQTVAIGYFALNRHTGTGGNSAIGAYAGEALVSGTQNSFYGSASGGGLRLNCNYNFAMGVGAMGSASGILATQQHYMNTAITGDTFIFLLTANLTIDAFQLMSCRGSSMPFLVKVIQANPNNGELIVASNVYIDTDSYLYFYNGGNLVVSTTYSGATITGTTFTIPTGLVGITNLLACVYTTDNLPTRKYIGVVSYNSTTGVLVVASSITVQTATNMKFWTQVFSETKGQNITDSCAFGKYALQNVGSDSQDNTAFGVACLNGCAGGYNNIEYLLGSSNSGFGANAGAGLSGLSSSCVFIGANSDFIGGLNKVCNNATVIGSVATVNSDNTTCIGASSFANAFNSTSIGFDSNANNLLGTKGTAIGALSTANGEYSTTVGTESITTKNYSTSVGGKASTSGLNSCAFGYSSQTIDDYDSAYGSLSKAVGVNSSVFGYNARSFAGESCAFGHNTIVGEYSVAIGSSATTGDTNVNGVAIGSNSSSETTSVACGAYAIAGISSVAVGASATTATTSNCIAIGAGASATGATTITIGTSSTSNGASAICIGKSSTANGASSLTLGNSSTAGFSNSIAIGHSVSITAQNQVIIGNSTNSVEIPGNLKVRSIYIPFSVYSNVIQTTGTTLPNSPVYGTYKVRFISNITISITIPSPVASLDGCTIVIRRLLGSTAGTVNNSVSNIQNLVVGSALQAGLLTSTQSVVSLVCLTADGISYQWCMTNLH
jgi:hypothetical protein